ncbi:MAG: hypothetical protein UR95_C0004G0028 [Parcubacteria group bacterium GW2011_GWC1_36_108]|nr:MAG: hypothetical protein UR95_C0004G0028 [Parcubacteria group bacterium GW2011_GWC1_36_108]HAR99510.1 hypothetical protein [Candidatus Moranbacteria bacterium]HBU11123.1 hypothetical protein [Candidatus Moranbacteria bacterium]
MDYEKYLEEIKSYIKKSSKKQRVLAVFVLITILAAVVFAINPEKKLLERRNSQRRSDVANILNSVYQYSIDHSGELPESITTQPTVICKSNALSCDGLVDISEITDDEKYLLSKVPVDPKEKNANSSGYQIHKLTNGRISVSAPLAENNAVISLSK